MLNNRKELVKRFLKEGFTYRTLSSFSDTQLKALSKKLFTEQVSEKDIKDKEKELADLYMAKAAELEEVETDEERNIETDPMGNPDIDIDGEPLLVELPQEVEEKFASKAQQKYLYSVNPAAAEKLASKMTKSDYEKLPEYVNEQEALESWITSLVESKELPTITKGNFIKTIKENLDVCVSVDTSSAVVMMEAVSAGAEIINDVRAFSNSAALEFAAKTKAALCVMHMQGRPASMQKSFHYDDLLGDVSSFLFERIKTLLDAGVSQNRLVIDPGFGFGKSLEHNYQLLKHLSFFQDLNLPIMVGISRKSMIGDIINRPAKERIYGSLAATVLALNNGALIIRTHDVSATVDSIRVHSLYQRA